ncbi:uncharacterized protein N7500_010347 [Penicillium coprophilum]|uniref:uncharacterized protein n=1 Tax=Penicillium coprophilum TaxID=36646 RepID=UPI002398B87B|nr:uncharacterized protein N7500_010347 [Penicillium coprophilum]KAJ5154908.1 hypothetical protein N7500_010347 [Penicillium coprophilum]
MTSQQDLTKKGHPPPAKPTSSSAPPQAGFPVDTQRNRFTIPYSTNLYLRDGLIKVHHYIIARGLFWLRANDRNGAISSSDGILMPDYDLFVEDLRSQAGYSHENSYAYVGPSKLHWGIRILAHPIWPFSSQAFRRSHAIFIDTELTMASDDPLRDSPPSIFRPRVRDGMIVVRRPPNRNDTAIFWAGTYFVLNEANEAVAMDYPAFLADLEALLRYDPELDEILFHMPSSYRGIALDPALPEINSIQDLQPDVGIVRTYNQWLAALAAMQSSHLMQESSIESVLRNGLVTSSVRHSVPPVAAAQFFIVRIADVEDLNQEGENNSGQD